MAKASASKSRELNVEIPGVETEVQLWERFPHLRPKREGGRRFYPLLGVVIVLLLWYALVWLFAMPTYILPTPHEIVVKILAEYPLILKHAWPTIFEAVAGFILATFFGMLFALLIVSSRRLGEMIMPIFIFSQTMPKVAIAPLFLIWFGFGYIPKIIISFLIAFFPIVIAMATGLNSVEREMLELLRSLSAKTNQIFLKARIPTALPYLFSGLKVAITLSVIGAIVGEFVGSDKGLGYLVLLANSDLDSPLLFAVLMTLALIGYLMFYLVCFLEKKLMPWHQSVKAKMTTREYTY
jgi:NitT/TauT family transport system permease protein